MEIFEFGELPNIVIHGVHFVVGKAKQSSVHVDVFSASEFWIEADAEFDEGNEGTVDGNFAFFGIIDAGEDFEKGGFARAVASDDADEFPFFDFEIDAAENLLLFVTLDTTQAIENGLL